MQPMLGGIVAFMAVGMQTHATECPPLNPISDDTGLSAALVLSEIEPGGHIELYNHSLVNIDLGVENYWLFARPTGVDLRVHAPDVTVPATGFATIPFPAAFIDNAEGGEIVLYRDISADPDFFNEKLIVDFVCWGVNNHLSVKVVAEIAGKWAGPCAPPLIIGSIHRLPGTAGIEAADYAVNLPPSPLDCAAVDCDCDTITPGVSTTEPKRLMHYQQVGGSSIGLLGLVSSNVVSPDAGWAPHVYNMLAPLVDRLGPGAFDWWGHNLGGIWPDQGVFLWENYFSSVLFAQIAIAREQYPALVDYEALSTFCTEYGINMFGYIGFPLCDAGGNFVFDPVQEHCNPDYFMNWYGELVDHGFKGIGHDFTAALPADSPALTENFTTLEAFGVRPFIEPVPFRGHTHLLGLSVVAEAWSWQNAALDPEHRYSEAEIVAAGGRGIHLVIRPNPNGPEVPDINQWRFDVSVGLLLNGRTIAVNLHSLMEAGYPVELLVVLSKLDLPLTTVAPN